MKIILKLIWQGVRDVLSSLISLRADQQNILANQAIQQRMLEALKQQQNTLENGVNALAQHTGDIASAQAEQTALLNKILTEVTPSPAVGIEVILGLPQPQ